MEQVRARVEERRREAASAAKPEPEPALTAEPDDGRGAATPARESTLPALPPSESFDFHGHSIYWSSRGGVGQILYGIRRFLRPLLKFVFNIDPMVDALSTQARRNAQQEAFDDEVARRLSALGEQHAEGRQAVEDLLAETRRLRAETNQLSTETRQLSAEMKDHRKLVESFARRLDALEQARADEPPALPHDGGPESPPAGGGPESPPADGGPETPAGGELPAPAPAVPSPPDVEPPPPDR